MFNIQKIMGVSALIYGVFVGLPAWAQASFNSTGNGADPITITLENTYAAGALAVEVDGVDMSALIQITGNVLTIIPVSGLATGQHELILYEITATDFAVIGNWSFATSGGGRILESIAIEATHEVGVVRDQTGETGPVGTSSGQVEVSLYDGRLTGGANYVVSSVEDNQINGRAVNLGEYFLEFRQLTDTVDLVTRLGHQGIDFDDVIISNIRRRGLGVTAETTSRRTFVGVFGTQASETLGYENITGLGEDDNRMFGVTAAFQPFSLYDFRIAATGYAGRGIPFDEGETGEGDGYALTLRGSFNDGRARYSIAAGQTNWDEDSGGPIGVDAADALLAAIEYDVFDPFDTLSGKSLSVGLTYEEVDAGFYSLANPDMPVGHQTIGVSAEYSNDPWYLLFAGSYQRTNTGGSVELETDEIYSVNLAGSYTLFLENPGPAWLGFDPLISFDVGYDTQNRLTTPGGALAQQDFTATYANIDLSTGYDGWGWGVGYGFLGENDESAENLDLTIHSVLANIDWFASDRLTFSADTTIDFIDDVDGEYMAGVVNLVATTVIVPDELMLTGRYTVEMSENENVETGGVFGTDLTWAFQENADIVFSGGISHGNYATETDDDSEWFAGVVLRVRTNIYK